MAVSTETASAQASGSWSRIRRHGEDAALLMIDADQLRVINETHGQACGDAQHAGAGHRARAEAVGQHAAANAQQTRQKAGAQAEHGQFDQQSGFQDHDGAGALGVKEKVSASATGPSS